jgi:hypothetical protein
MAACGKKYSDQISSSMTFLPLSHFLHFSPDLFLSLFLSQLLLALCFLFKAFFVQIEIRGVVGLLCCVLRKPDIEDLPS